MTLLFLLLAVLFLAFSNGANDNFKGVATLFGSRTTNYSCALIWATTTTLAGSLASLAVSRGLVKAFSGKGLVGEAVTNDASFLLAVGLGAGLTVMIATILGTPVSTTHALTGALVGAGLVFAGGVNLMRLGTSFFLPLALSPFLSLLLTSTLYPALRWCRLRLGVERHMCLCLDDGPPALVHPGANRTVSLLVGGVTLTADQMERCEERYQGRLLGFDAQKLLDKLHFVSAGLVGFARGLNDHSQNRRPSCSGLRAGHLYDHSSFPGGSRYGHRGPAGGPQGGEHDERRDCRYEPRSGVYRQSGHGFPGHGGFSVRYAGLHHPCLLR